MYEITLFMNDTTGEQFGQWLDDYTRFGQAIHFTDEQGRAILNIQHARLMRPLGGGLPFAEMDAILVRETSSVAQRFPTTTCFRFEWIAVGPRLKVKIDRQAYYERTTGYFQGLLSEIVTTWPETSSAVREYRNSLSEQSHGAQASVSLELPANRIERIYVRSLAKFADILTDFIHAWFGINGNRQAQFSGVKLTRDGIFWAICNAQGLELITLITSKNDDNDREVYVKMWPMQWEMAEQAEAIQDAFEEMVKYLDNRIQSANRTQALKDTSSTATTVTNQSGGVGVDAEHVNIGNDVVGRDKIESAGGHIIHAAAGATVIVNEPSVVSEDAQNRQGPAEAETTSNTKTGRGKSTPPQSTDMLFDCGHRIRQIREDLRLTASQFAEAISYSSVKAFELLELRQAECSESVLRRVADFSGTATEWLKHGKGKKYPPTDFYFYPLDQATELIKGLAPTGLHFFLELKSYEVLFLAQKGEYCWQVLDMKLDLDFWNWQDSLVYIPRFYAFLDFVHGTFGDIVESRFLPKPVIGKLKKGNEHPLRLLRSSKLAGYGWADDIRDIYHRYPAATHYGQRYGEWFLKVQDEFRKYIELYIHQSSSQ